MTNLVEGTARPHSDHLDRRGQGQEHHQDESMRNLSGRRRSVRVEVCIRRCYVLGLSACLTAACRSPAEHCSGSGPASRSPHPFSRLHAPSGLSHSGFLAGIFGKLRRSVRHKRRSVAKTIFDSCRRTDACTRDCGAAEPIEKREEVCQGEVRREVRERRQRAQAACRPQPSRTDGEILVAHFVLRPPPLGECHSRVERRCREW